jgi:hypothetical protein
VIRPKGNAVVACEQLQSCGDTYFGSSVEMQSIAVACWSGGNHRAGDEPVVIVDAQIVSHTGVNRLKWKICDRSWNRSPRSAGKGREHDQANRNDESNAVSLHERYLS